MLLRNSDIMVLPSMRECGGAVVLEAMASGVPVIAAKWGGPADYISEGTGILIPPDRQSNLSGISRCRSGWRITRMLVSKWDGLAESRQATL